MTTVLLVEDELDVAELIQDALEDAKLDVQVAHTDEAAYQSLAREARSFDVLVADINLGVGTTGFDVARRARQLNPKLKVVYITGHAAHQSRFGVSGSVMFPKPFNPRELADQIEALVADDARGA